MESKQAEAVSQKLAPTEIRGREFKKVAWGYSPREVVEFLDSLAKTWEKVQKQEKELQDKIRSLNDELTRWKNKEHEIAKLKERALQEGQQIREEASAEATRQLAEVEERANGIRGRTEEWLESVIQEVEETQRQKASFMTAFKAALDSHYELIKTEENDPEPLAAKLSQFLRAQSHAAVTGQPPPRT